MSLLQASEMVMSCTPKLSGLADPVGTLRKMEKLGITLRFYLKFKEV